MAKKAQKKGSAKKSKAKPSSPKAPPEEPPVEKVLRFVAHGYQFPKAMADLKAEMERYYRRGHTPKLEEARAYIDATVEARRNPTPTPTPAAKTAVIPAKPKTLGPQARQALRVLAQLFPKDKYPEGVPDAITTKDLVRRIKGWMKLDALQRKVELLPAPEWDAVNVACKEFNRTRTAPS